MSTLKLKRTKQNLVYHADSNLIVRSPTDKTVIGRLEGSECKKLTEEDIKLCKKYELKYDENCLEGAVSEEAAEEESENQEEEEVKEVIKEVIKEPVKEVIKEPVKESVKEIPRESAREVSKDISSIVEALQSFEMKNKEMQNHLSDELEKSKTEIISLKAENEELRKKMKKILAAMQDTL